PEVGHVVDLLSADRGSAPGAGYNPEPFHRKEYSRLVGPLIVPVADYHVLRDHVHRAVRVVHAGLPHTDAGGLAVDEAIAPDPQFPPFRRQVIADACYFPGKKLGLVASAATRAFVVADIKYFVHSRMKRVGLEHLANLIH